MRLVHVIHGYPPRYNAGSEVYTQSLCRALAARHEVHVFTREEDPFRADFALRTEADAGDPRVALHVVNVARSRDRYRHAGVDQRFAELLDRVQPDVLHIGHLNHLSTSLVREASARGLPIVFTLHDFWLMCPRGQFMQMHSDEGELWAACDGQDDEKCARRCYARYFSGAEAELSIDVDHWKGWVARRMQHVREMTELVDVFVAPSEYLHRRFRDEYGLPAVKLVHMDYGFDRARLAGRTRTPGEPFTFGYIGTHIPAKGVQLLLEAFGRVDTDARLRIWGRPRGQETEALRALAARLPHDAGQRVEWLPEYENERITRDVLDRVDAIVVPSIWVENSPLVIHEALQARVPVITANVGGMAELVQHEVNGLLFDFRDAASLARQMGRIASEPSMAAQLGARGYLASTSGDVIDIREHAAAIERLYADVIARRDSSRIASSPGPWRVTLDTNPDTCNLKCVMCEEHSEHSLLQVRRKEAGKPRRVMPIELVRKVIADAAPHGLREVIPSTMGEPLLYDDFEKIFEYRSDEASIAYQQRKEYREGFLLFDDDLWDTINLRNNLFSYQDGLFRQEIPAFNEQAVREAVLNAVSHRDYRLAGSTFVKQYPQRIQVDSPGGFPAGVTAENILLRQSPRNRRLADALGRCGLVERSGQGADRMFSSAVREGKLPPDFSGSDDYQVSVVLHGQVQDERFVGFMERLGREAQRALSLDDLIALDAVHRELPVPERVAARIPALIEMGAVERVGRKLLLSKRFYASVGKRGEYTRRRGLDRATNKALLVEHLRQSGREGSPLAELNQVLPSMKPTQLQHLLRELKHDRQVHSVGRTKGARWYLGPHPTDGQDD